MTAEVKVGKIYAGRVVSIKEFGAFVEIAPETDGLCHVSELSRQVRAERRRISCNIGDEVRVKVILIDDQGRIKLSRKAAMKEEGPERSRTGRRTPAADTKDTGRSRRTRRRPWPRRRSRRRPRRSSRPTAAGGGGGGRGGDRGPRRD